MEPAPPTIGSAPGDGLNRAGDPATPPDRLAACACDLRMGIRRAAAANPATPQHIIDLLRRAGASKDLTRIQRRPGVLTTDDAATLAGLGPWAEQLAALQPAADATLLERLAGSSRGVVRQRVAEHPNAPTPVLGRLLLDADEAVRASASAHPSTPSELAGLIALAEQRSSTLSADQLDELAGLGPQGRLLAARHPKTCVASLEHLARDPDWRVRAAVAEHPDATASMLAPLSSLGSREVNALLAGHANTPGQALAALAEEQDTEVRFAVASHAQAPPAVLCRLLEDGSDRVRSAAADNPNTPGDAVERLRQAEAKAPLPADALEAFAAGGPWARRLAAQHPGTPTPALHRLAADADPFIRELVAARGAVPKLLTRLGSSADLQGTAEPDAALTATDIGAAAKLGPWARTLAARHPNASAMLLQQLASDEHWQARRAVARHRSTPGEALVLLSNDPIADVRWSLVLRGALPTQALRRLAIDEHAAVRVAVAQHADTPGDVLVQLSQDRDEDVRAAAGVALGQAG